MRKKRLGRGNDRKKRRKVKTTDGKKEKANDREYLREKRVP